MALQYYQVGNQAYSLDKASGAASKISSIPTDGATINWTGSGLPPELQSALGNASESNGSTAYTPSVTPTSTPYVSDSSSAISGENSTLSTLSSLNAQAPNYSDLLNNYNNSVDSITNYQNELEARRQAAVQQIQNEYAQEEQDTENAQKAETGSTSVALTRLGGYLGGSGSGVGVLNNLAATHKTELAKLASQRDAAIQQANNAASDKDFELAQQKIDEANNLTDTIYSRQQDFFNNALKLQGAQQDAMSAQESQAKDVLSAWSGVTDPTAIPDDQKKLIDSIYGNGFSDSYLAAAKATNDAAAAKDESDQQKAQLDAMQSYVNLIESVPSGTQIPFGDETITGIGKTSDITTFQVKDSDTGDVRVVNYNKGNGQFSITNLGQIGGTSSSKSASGASVIAQAMQTYVPGATLSDGTPVYDSDGHITPQAWQSLLKNLQEQGVSRQDAITAFGYKLLSDGGTISAAYGLTPVEQKTITGALPSGS